MARGLLRVSQKNRYKTIVYNGSMIDIISLFMSGYFPMHYVK